ncbi:single-stranded DNA-binding protein [Egbenema bharatensis]|uniref:single-stranded DNA-binding protein n=1 Tax=Egbenema bharatensis TaxID=3463334 RepID=UPI003A83A3F6
MNSCILMAEVIQEPQIRYTPDSQLAVAEMTVELPGLRDDDPPTQLKVVGWGNLAQEIQEKYHPGDRVIIEGRLHMNTVDRPEGFKEKRAELTAQRIHLLAAGTTLSTISSVPTSTVASGSNTSASSAPSAPSTPKAPPAKREASEPARTPAYSAAPTSEPDYDDIPF